MSLNERLVDVASLKLSEVARQVMTQSLYRELRLTPPSRGKIEVLDNVVVSGIADLQAAVANKATKVRVQDCPELEGEDDAVVLMHQGRDLLPVAKDPLAAGLVYRETKQIIERLPKRNTEKDKASHRRKYAVSRAVRLRWMWRVLFGTSEAELQRYALALDAPLEVRLAYRAGSLTLSRVHAIVKAGDIVATAIGREISAGVSPDEAINHHLKDENRCRSVRAALGTFVRSTRRGVDELGDRIAEVDYLTETDIQTFGEARSLIDNLLEQGRRIQGESGSACHQKLRTADD